MAVFQSSSHYAGWENSPFARPTFVDTFLDRVYARDFTYQITNNSITEEVTRCGQDVHFIKPPYVGPWRPYEKNQELVPNQINAEGICLRICHAAYQDIKMDKVDIWQACEFYTQWEAGFLEDMYQQYTKMNRRWVLTRMILEASPMNKGSNAGIYGNIDLGEPSAPVEVTPQNVGWRLSQLMTVLEEQERWVDGEMFIILPPIFKGILALSNFADAAAMGSCVPCSILVDGMWDRQLYGFNVIFTNEVPRVQNPDGTVDFYIIAGNAAAFAFISTIIEARVIEGIRTFGIEYQMLAIWGGKMLYPEAVAVAYWRFNPNLQ